MKPIEFSGSFVNRMRQYYLATGHDYKEATRHATADYDWWRAQLGLSDDKELTDGTDDTRDRCKADRK